MTDCRRLFLILAVLALTLLPALRAASRPEDAPGRLEGLVRTASGEALAGVQVSLQSGERTSISGTRTGTDGRFVLPDLPPGRYLLVVSAPGFNERRLPAVVGTSAGKPLEIVLQATPVEAEVTVSSTPGSVLDRTALTQPVNVIESFTILERAKAVVAQIALEEPGLQLLRTSPSIAGIYIRGLTGNKVNTFVDGVRYSTSAVRGGITTFMDLVDPAMLQAAEILRGPNSAQYGSDALGGSIQFLTLVPALSDGPARFSGTYGARFGSADSSYGANVMAQYSSARLALLVGGAARTYGDLRPGGGLDSHSAVSRFFGLSSDRFIDSRLPDTGFTQYGGLIKLNWAPTASDQILVSYWQNRQDRGKRYDQLLGGDGNLVADLRGLRGDMLIVKYNRFGLGPFDQFTAVYSYNAQREERVNQGGNGNPLATITYEPERTAVHGFQLRAVKSWAGRQELLFGFDYYPEQIEAPSTGYNPSTGAFSVRRGRVPDGATYASLGAYVQDTVVLIADRLKFVGGLRYSAARYESKASNSPLVNGQPLWPDDSLTAASWTYRAGLVGTLGGGFTVSANVSRGFRAPHMTDLGTLGLTGSGFQVSANAVRGLGATIGDSASASAVSTGLPVEGLRPETSLSWEAGLAYHGDRLSSELSVFLNTIRDNIVYQSLILPQGAVGLALGDQVISSQAANGVVYVPASSSPVLVRTNFGDARITGLEHRFEWQVSERWSASTVLTLLHAEDIATGLPPNIEGGTPGADFYLKLRYSGPGGRFWLEPYLHAMGRQTRLSSLDLEDRRTGAARSRSSIKNFFNNGARARGWIGPGADGIAGTSDDVLLETGETLAQIQDRVLGAGVGSSSLFTAVPGFVTSNIRAGFRVGRRGTILIELENLGDVNYRGIAWGLDAAGRGISISYLSGF